MCEMRDKISEKNACSYPERINGLRENLTVKLKRYCWLEFRYTKVILHASAIIFTFWYQQGYNIFSTMVNPHMATKSH
jgi:hypothetical protein